MRTEKELWEVVLSRPDLFHSGLCVWIMKAFVRGLITCQEELYLRKIIGSKRKGDLIFWIGPYNELQPRIDWIKKRIETL